MEKNLWRVYRSSNKEQGKHTRESGLIKRKRRDL